jgi:hypothetical protein
LGFELVEDDPHVLRIIDRRYDEVDAALGKCYLERGMRADAALPASAEAKARRVIMRVSSRVKFLPVCRHDRG